MRVRHISVTGLFGVFNHEIPLNEDSRITLIHGLNGYGKTVMLQMIRSILHNQYEIFWLVPFKRFEMRLSDERCLRIDAEESQVWHRGRAWPEELRVPQWLKVTLLASDVFQAGMAMEFQTSMGPYQNPQAPWLDALRNSIDVRLVQTERLGVGDDSGRGTPAVKTYAADLNSQIRSALGDYVWLSQKIDRTFPTRFLQRKQVEPVQGNELERRLSELKQKRARFAALGLLEQVAELDEVPQVDDPQKFGALAIYIEDIDEKLRVFDQLAAKIELFLSIINNHFRYKRISIDGKRRTFMFTMPDGTALPLEYLSSGEQHELVMLYELLFMVKPDSLILIDEPELSLHLAWQQQFLEDLEKVVKLSGIDVLIATHSPEIIGEHWDWTVELKGPKA